MKVIKIILALSITLILTFFGLPNPRKNFEALYPKQDNISDNFNKFREIPLQSLQVNQEIWNYLSVGQGKECILFLHGMGGAYDIWWQQIVALKDSFRIIAPTYPAVNTMSGLAEGILAILAKENQSRVHVIGSSLGGDLAQYLCAYHPEIVKSAVFGNTFVPDSEFKAVAEPMFASLKWAPGWLSMYVFRKGIRETHYPASGNSDFLLAYLLEQGYGAMSASQFSNRAWCVLDIYDKRLSIDIPLLIIESDNDPLVPLPFREKLKDTYPGAAVYTFSGAGHFPYLSHPDLYTQIIKEHLRR